MHDATGSYRMAGELGNKKQSFANKQATLLVVSISAGDNMSQKQQLTRHWGDCTRQVVDEKIMVPHEKTMNTRNCDAL